MVHTYGALHSPFISTARLIDLSFDSGAGFGAPIGLV